MTDRQRTVVKYSARFTRNMGNFESLQIDIGVEDQPRGEETASQAMNRVMDFVEDRLLDKVAELEGDIKEIRK